ncbi:cell wall hydrolase [Parasphingorhabdus cellanae]|uniref:Cell wall hydrolase n=1 Tax=Parasphingorhabdus cellanae TaxID=2806553 RepID=A0ABX7T6U5_9SPHN|nr:cell wall hydrolase [Parasphingorhabdus cellanae]QTD56237.1 cell wall hydrolase [Parasphingorhabdus cellanae]
MLFVVLFCLIPLAGLFLSSTSIFHREKASISGVSVPLAPPKEALVSALPGLPNAVPDIAEQLSLNLSAEDAIKLNNSIPDSKREIVPARPFSIPSTVASQLSRSTAVNCLTSAIYYEAASEAEQGQRAVAQVVLNRVRHPAYPNNICGVVFQGSERSTGCQFSFTCDGSLARKPIPAIWTRVQKLAADAISGKVEKSVGTATHYHTVWIVPYWAKSLDKVKTVGSHIFYRWSGYWGKRQAFSQQYIGEDLSDTASEDRENDDVMEYALDEQLSDEQSTYVTEVDPIITPKFEAAPSAKTIPKNGGVAADNNQSPLAADRNKGTLILD